MGSILLYSLSATAFGFLGWTIHGRKDLSKKDFIRNVLAELGIGLVALFFAIKN